MGHIAPDLCFNAVKKVFTDSLCQSNKPVLYYRYIQISVFSSCTILFFYDMTILTLAARISSKGYHT